MNKEKIAILVDSGADIPKELLEKYNIYVVPLKVIYEDQEYSDGVDITPQEVYKRLESEIPTTSLPSGNEINFMFDKIKDDGYEKLLVVTISSGLSGTYNYIKLLASQYNGLEIFVLDTKNIGIATGFNAIQAAEYIEEGMDWDTLTKTLSKNVTKSKIFFTLDTLKYLHKGGRIGLVASVLGTALNIRPIISCNNEGIYYAVDKIIGKKRAIKKVIDLALDFAKNTTKYNIAIVHSAAEKDAKKIKDILMPHLPNCNIFTGGQISPALGVHTGPKAIGIAVQLLD